MQNAAQKAANSRGHDGHFETDLTVRGETVTIRGVVMNGKAKVGTFFREKGVGY